MITFTDPKGKDRNAFLKPINNINQIIKHTFETCVITGEGRIYQGENKIGVGYHMGECDLHTPLLIPRNKMIKIDTTVLYKAIQNKKEIVGYTIKDNYIAFILNENVPLLIAQVEDTFDELDKFKNDISHNLGNVTCRSIIAEDEILDLVDKKVVEKYVDNYRMILTHKILPNIKKCDVCNIEIIDIDEKFFIGVFNILSDDVKTIHIFRFLKF